MYYTDFIFSIGEDCACSSYLRANKLQIMSYPFDWLTKASFETRIEMLLSDFSNFLNIEDMEFLGSYKENIDLYANTHTNFNFYHDFPADIPLEKSLPEVQEKYNRRINRLYNQIDKAQNILCVWFSRTVHLNNEQILSAHQKLSQKFPNKNIQFLIIENDESQADIKEEIIEGYAFKYTYNMFSSDTSSALSVVKGNTKLGNKVFRKFKLKLSLLQKIKLMMIKCIPNKKLRKKLLGFN